MNICLCYAVNQLILWYKWCIHFFPCIGSAFTASDNLSLSSWVTTTSGFSGFQHPQSLSAIGSSTASLASPLPHPIQGSLPPYSRLGMPLTPSALAGSMQGSGPTFPSFHMPRYHHYFQQGPYAAIQGLRHSSTVMTPFVWFLPLQPDKISQLPACEDTRKTHAYTNGKNHM